MIWPDLEPILKPIRWAVVGGAATRLYMPERATDDFDIAVAAVDSIAVRARMRAAGYQPQHELSIGGSAWRDKAGLDIDVIEGHDPWWPGALSEAQANRDGQGLPILPLPYLVIMKMQASRATDIGDLTRMLGGADEPLRAAVRAVVMRYAPADVEDLESLIQLGKLEYDNA